MVNVVELVNSPHVALGRLRVVADHIERKH
jgi:hypothetical protein